MRVLYRRAAERKNCSGGENGGGLERPDIDSEVSDDGAGGSFPSSLQAHSLPLNEECQKPHTAHLHRAPPAICRKRYPRMDRARCRLCGASLEAYPKRRACSRKSARMSATAKKWIFPGAGALLLLVVVFVWPTLYRYTEMKSSSLTLPVRVNRFTGKAEILYQDWLPLGGDAEPPHEDKPVELSPEEVKLLRLTWKSQTRASDRFDVTLYNGSSHALSDVLVEVPIYSAQEPVPSPPATSQKPTEPGLEGLPSWATEAARRTKEATPKLAERRKYRLSPKGLGGAPALQVSEWELSLGFNAEGGGPFVIEAVSATIERP